MYLLRMQAYDKAIKRGHPEPQSYVRGLHLPGWYKGCINCWKRERERSNWSLICAACPKIAKKHKEVPDSVRKFLGVEKKFVSRTAKGDTAKGDTCILPVSFQQTLADAIVPRLVQFAPLWHSDL